MADYSQFAFAVTVDQSAINIYVAGQRKGTIPLAAVPPQAANLVSETDLLFITEDGNQFVTE